jgi:hypothetical protein
MSRMQLSEVLGVRLSRAQLRLIRATARRLGLSPSGLARRVMLDSIKQLADEMEVAEQPAEAAP